MKNGCIKECMHRLSYGSHIPKKIKVLCKDNMHTKEMNIIINLDECLMY